MKKQLAKSNFAARIGMAGALASAMLFAVPAPAQDARLSLADRVARLEQQAQNQTQGGVGMVNQMQQLQEQVRSLQGQVEELRHQLQQLEEKNKVQYIDLDSRLGRLEGNAAGTAATPSSAGASPASAASSTSTAATGAAMGDAGASSGQGASADPAQAQAAYDDAFKTLRGGDFVGASRAFRDFLQQYPGSALAPNAYYWLGESYYGTMNYAVALETFQQLLQRFPDSQKASDALLKVGYSQLELKQDGPGKDSLQAVVSKYPGSSAARLAQERLRRLQLQSAN